MPTNLTSPEEVHAALADLKGQQAWAAIRLLPAAGAAETVTLIGGTPREVSELAQIPLAEGVPEHGPVLDYLVAVPFQQVRERGFEAHEDDAPLVAVAVESHAECSAETFLAAVPDGPVEFADTGGFETSDEEYGAVVESIIRDEIGQGEGANLVIGRHYRAVLADWDANKALTVFRRLLARERGSYWTFCFFTGERFLIGASPERHVSVVGGAVRMNPISGTFRVPKSGTIAETKTALLDFLTDEKEIYELFMVVDEELKMMCDICNEGGQVLGPFLKPMTHLIHTEYLLAGRTTRDVRDVLRDSMFAATVTGSPVENACRLIKQYESEGRGYYAAALALIGRDASGQVTADSPIVIRTADVSIGGRLKVTAGATLVRDSEPASEVAETWAKASGILSAFGLVPPAHAPAADIAALARDEDVLIQLASRNQRLSKFWLTDQSGASVDPDLAGKTAVILDGEDDFINMMRHMLSVLGMKSQVVRQRDYVDGALDGFDLVIVGPGPGDPRDDNDPKIQRVRRALDRLLQQRQPFLAVCLGHQSLCHRLGIELTYKDIVFQGTQSPVEYDNRTERVGFYNTFVGRVGPAGPPAEVVVQADADSGDINKLIGPHYRGIQFHAESILTENGFPIVHALVRELIAGAL